MDNGENTGLTGRFGKTADVIMYSLARGRATTGPDGVPPLEDQEAISLLYLWARSLMLSLIEGMGSMGFYPAHDGTVFIYVCTVSRPGA